MGKVSFEFSEEREPGIRRLEAKDATAGVNLPRRWPEVPKAQLG